MYQYSISSYLGSPAGSCCATCCPPRWSWTRPRESCQTWEVNVVTWPAGWRTSLCCPVPTSPSGRSLDWSPQARRGRQSSPTWWTRRSSSGHAGSPGTWRSGPAGGEVWAGPWETQMTSPQSSLSLLSPWGCHWGAVCLCTPCCGQSSSLSLPSSPHPPLAWPYTSHLSPLTSHSSLCNWSSGHQSLSKARKASHSSSALLTVDYVNKCLPSLTIYFFNFSLEFDPQLKVSGGALGHIHMGNLSPCVIFSRLEGDI